MCLCVSVRERRSGLVSLEVESCGGDDLKDLNVHLISYFTGYKYNIKQICKEVPKFVQRGAEVWKEKYYCFMLKLF